MSDDKSPSTLTCAITGLGVAAAAYGSMCLFVGKKESFSAAWVGQKTFDLATAKVKSERWDPPPAEQGGARADAPVGALDFYDTNDTYMFTTVIGLEGRHDNQVGWGPGGRIQISLEEQSTIDERVRKWLRENADYVSEQKRLIARKVS